MKIHIKKSKKKKEIFIVISEDLYIKIKNLSITHDCTTQEIIRYILDDSINNYE